MKHLGAWALTRRYEPVLVNPPREGLVCTMPRVMAWALEVPPGTHSLVDMDSSLTFASPVITRYRTGEANVRVLANFVI